MDNTTSKRDAFVAAYVTALKECYAGDPSYMAQLRLVPWVRNGGLSAQPDDYLWLRLAMRMTDSFIAGTANKDGTACKKVFKALGVKPTYKAIAEYFK